MILFLLLQVAGFEAFQLDVKVASRFLKVPVPIIKMEPVDSTHPLRMAWAPICDRRPPATCPALVYIATDVAELAPREVITYYAYHEVCHLKLGHTSYAWGLTETQELADTQVKSCMRIALGKALADTLERDMLHWGNTELRHRRYRVFGDVAYR